MYEIYIENVWRKNNDRRLSLTIQSSEEHKEKNKEKKRKRNGQESALFCFLCNKMYFSGPYYYGYLYTYLLISKDYFEMSDIFYLFMPI